MYLFEKEEKTLLIISSPKKTLQTDFRVPTIYNTLIRLLAATGFSLLHTTIYRFLDEVYYAYLGIGNGVQEYEINCEVYDAVSLAQYMCTPIYTESCVLKEQGISVTKELLESALARSD